MQRHTSSRMPAHPPPLPTDVRLGDLLEPPTARSNLPLHHQLQDQRALECLVETLLLKATRVPYQLSDSRTPSHRPLHTSTPKLSSRRAASEGSMAPARRKTPLRPSCAPSQAHLSFQKSLQLVSLAQLRTQRSSPLPPPLTTTTPMPMHCEAGAAQTESATSRASATPPTPAASYLSRRDALPAHANPLPPLHPPPIHPSTSTKMASPTAPTATQ